MALSVLMSRVDRFQCEESIAAISGFLFQFRMVFVYDKQYLQQHDSVGLVNSHLISRRAEALPRKNVSSDFF